MPDKPQFEETACPRCGDSDGLTSDEAVQLVKTASTDGSRTRVIWCAAGHITVVSHQGKVTEVNDWDGA